MKKFGILIGKLILLGAVCVLLYHGIFYFLWEWDKGPNAYSHAYQKALLLQYHALKDPEREEEIIIFGSSYVPFGIDTQTIEERTGEKTQILGVEASIGIPYLIDVLYDTAKPGDTIIYMLGKSNWSNEDFMTISAALESDKELLTKYWESRGDTIKFHKNLMIWRKMYALLAAGPIETVRSHISDKEQVYDLSSFDERGNMTVERAGTLISTDISPTDSLIFEDMETETLDALNEFSAWCKERDITFVIAYSMFIEGSIAQSEEELDLYCEQMEDYMDADFIGTLDEMLLPVEYFYNHMAHLNSEGARIYSERLADAIMEYRAGE